MSLLESKPYRLFFSSLRSPESRKSYSIYINKYMKLQEITDLLAESDPRLIEQQIINFVIRMTEKGKHYSSLHNYVTAVLSFYKINDIVLNTNKISKFMPEQTRMKKDRSYTHEEIGKLLEIADERMRVIILLMASTGMRIGALPELKLRNLEKMEALYKITVYENYKQEYQTFCSHECLSAIDSYLDFRKRYGEILATDSYLIREQFDVRDQFAISCPKKTKSHTLTYKLMDLALRCGIRKKENLLEGQTSADGASLRKEVAIAHGFRKFFTTQCINSKLNPEICKKMTSLFFSSDRDAMVEEASQENIRLEEFDKLNFIPQYLKGLQARAETAIERSEIFSDELESERRLVNRNDTPIPDKATIREEYIKCGKLFCYGCPHGPYYYAYWKDENRKLKKK